MEFMEWKLFWEGMLNRSDLEDQFEISTPQASVDLKRYREASSGNMEYDPTRKAFLPSGDLRPSFLRPSADRLLLQLRAHMTDALPRRDVWFKRIPPVGIAPDLARHVEPGCLRVVLAAMRDRSCIDVEYQSLTNMRLRRIAPHALAFDGQRWHVRAWSCDQGDFRDFVLSRMGTVDGMHAADYDPRDDVEWNTHVVLRLRPHAGLTPQQSLAIQRDFDMEGGRRDVGVRLSMAYYFIRRMNLDLEDLPPARAQVRLENLGEIEEAIRAARAESVTRIASRSREAGLG